MKDREYYRNRIAELDHALRDPSLTTLAKQNIQNARDYAARKIAEMDYFDQVIMLN